MYTYTRPEPIVYDLGGRDGFAIREEAANYVTTNPNRTGAERGSLEQQGYGALAELVVRKNLGLPTKPDDHPVGHDLSLESGVKIDVKCRGGTLPFQAEYEGRDGTRREAKHNLFARQLHDDKLDTDVYLLTHLRTPTNGALPGTHRQRNWALYVCGWVSKAWVERNGVYLPRGSLTERGNTWFTYRGQEVEVYHQNLNGLASIRDLLALDQTDIEVDSLRETNLNMTSVDAIRIALDLVGRGLLEESALTVLTKQLGLSVAVQPILHPNQYNHLAEWLARRSMISDDGARIIGRQLPKESFEEI